MIDSRVTVTDCCSNFDDLIVAMNTNISDTLVINIDLLGKNYINALTKIKMQKQTVILLTKQTDNFQLQDFIHFDIAAIINTDRVITELIPCIYRLYDNKEIPDNLSLRPTPTSQPATVNKVALYKSLTPHEEKIAILVAKGLSNKEIARKINSTEGAVKTFLHRIYIKMEINGRVMLASLVNESNSVN